MNQIRIDDYNYTLPEDRIAKFPLQCRDSSKLLEFRDGCISDHVFRDLPDLLPCDSMMVFNETKVVPARLHFHRLSGANIEIFCLEPRTPSDYATNFASVGTCKWKCIVGNVKRWKYGEEICLTNSSDDKAINELALTAILVERNAETSVVEFRWRNGMEFSEVLDLCGTIPIPPYLNRETQSIDLERYQTTYAKWRGSVAAPTAGLHFTPEVMRKIAANGIEIQKVCLHVGAGTFLPVKSETIEGHSMHREPFAVSVEFLKKLSDALKSGKNIIAVGTTSVRTLESLYWAGNRCLEGRELTDIMQWEPYDREEDGLHAADKCIDALVSYCRKHSLEQFSLGTSIIIVPGYRLRVVNALITNFHQPKSTLLLLISAFVGEKWHEIYSHAMSNSYRFLSYGDSSLLFPVH